MIYMIFTSACKLSNATVCALKRLIISDTCSFTVSCVDECLVKFFGKAHISQLCSVEPYQQHPVPMLSVAVLTFGQRHTALCGQENNSTSETKV